ncbi:MAG TPA: glycoside hydrolase family 76 protein, partial [Verrucomicrobiae bacterium]
MALLVRSAAAYTAADVNTVFSAYNSEYYFQSGTNGYFANDQSGGIEYFWSQAEEVECVIDAYEWNPTPTTRSMVTNLLNGFLTVNGAIWTNKIYNDDIMWAAMAFCRGGMLTGMTNYCNVAKTNFDLTYARAWDTVLGGGLYWTTDRGSKNACVNGPGSIAASLLYQAYNDSAYLAKATAIYNWERSVLFNTNSGAIYDNIGTNGVIGTWASTYNQGTFLGAANFLGQTNEAALAVHFTMQNLTTGGVLPEYGINGNNSGFNAIYLRWMNRYVKNRGLQALYSGWLQTNAVAAWSLRRTNDNLSWCQWLHATPAGTNFNSWDAISSYEALLAADPTQSMPAQPVAADMLGYWPLNEGSGTTAGDRSGNGNAGVINNATWSSSGRMGNCLVFNGATSYVQVTNPLANDFTIAFWVKTTQANNAGNWYNGAGLVDGDTPGGANDFGTALCSGKFAFGTGNPDQTIASSVAINDGVWHHCV